MDAEDREDLKIFLKKLMNTLLQVESNNMEEAIEHSKEIGFPLLIRSSLN